jgi:hypothetical protein
MNELLNYWTFSRLSVLAALRKRVSLSDSWKRFQEWRLSLGPDRSPAGDQRPWITFDAFDALENRIREGFSVFEYGMGGSTLYFLKMGCRVASVDHDELWWNKLSAQIESLPGASERWSGKLVLPEPMQVLKGEVAFASGMKKYSGMDFTEYVRELGKHDDNSFDLVLVDGRARVEAAFIAAEKVKPGGLVILDNSERARYQAIHEQFAARGWKSQRYFGPGPYVISEFWETTFFERPLAS